MATRKIVQLEGNSSNRSKTVEDIVKLERKIFPKHESLARSFDEELIKKNSGLLYVEVDNGQLAGYVMYSWPSSLYASITKLAGFPNPFFFLCIFSLQIQLFVFRFFFFPPPITVFQHYFIMVLVGQLFCSIDFRCLIIFCFLGFDDLVVSLILCFTLHCFKMDMVCV